MLGKANLRKTPGGGELFRPPTLDYPAVRCLVSLGGFRSALCGA